jgi:PiT family inorganic phosphate transporter
VAQRILIAWVLTIPASALVAYLTYQVLNPLLGK